MDTSTLMGSVVFTVMAGLAQMELLSPTAVYRALGGTFDTVCGFAAQVKRAVMAHCRSSS